jgi:hypothetical protein
MRLLFTKCAGKTDRLEILRSGTQSEFIDCPKQRILPHDMMHYAVESTLRVRGFLGRVKDGESASQQMQGEDFSDAIERLVEVFQGDAWSGGQAPACDLLDLYAVTCDARRCPTLAIDEQMIEDVRRRIAELTARWNGVPVGGTLELQL